MFKEYAIIKHSALLGLKGCLLWRMDALVSLNSQWLQWISQVTWFNGEKNGSNLHQYSVPLLTGKMDKGL